MERSERGAALLVGERVVSEARAARVPLDLPSPVGFADALRATEAFDVEAYAAHHPFPTCYTCGPGRPDDDGLGLFPAPISRTPVTVTWPWVPDASLPNEDDVVDPAIVWAALDCPSGLAWMVDPGSAPAVLGRMTAEVRRRPRVGEPLVVAGWRIAADGRKLHAGSAVWSNGGEVIAANAATWIMLTDEQHGTFSPAG